ncbi:Reverse transcriptase domain [Arabidopsis thaliana x Arabidopsis arenosa]|uniref:Reverse transcriptase domain n=1 Tax=Arabidopsis thaliana x Arabidopsis arenosa TaxID=1240361 RepID=A0A8T1XIV0_9BRAS|nr:Reverse transcriptase domain [Arabidopsis thaliana x Arabidopsis arenosa]
MSDRLRKSVQDLTLGIDDEPVALPPEFCSQAAQVNRFSVVVTTVNPRKQNLRALIGQMPRVWGFPDSCVGRILDRGRVQFKFQTEEAMNLVLRRGPWSFNDWMLSIHRWYPNISEAEMKIIPFWVQIQGIPLLFLTNAMARCVGNRLGNVAEVDFDENVNHPGFVRVQIKWNMDDPLRFQRNFQFVAEENTVIKYRFERLRNFCTKCGSLKHDAKECTLSFEDEDPIEDSDDDDNNDDHHGDESDRNMSDTETLQTVDPVSLIPGLQASVPSVGFNKSVSNDVSSLPSAFVDTELTAERLRYLHAKFSRSNGLHAEKKDFLEASSDNAQQQFVFMKRKRVQFEAMYQRDEAADEMAVLSHFCKKERRTESAGSCSRHDGIDGGAGGPPPCGRSGGLALMWKNSVSLSLISRDERLIDAHVTYNNKSFHLSCVYGHPVQSERYILWEKLERIAENRDEEWMLIGDFNEILSNSEKIGGPLREEWTFRDFRNMVANCDLVDMRSRGDRFSWVGERHSHTVKCCLDRVFINSAMAASFPNAETEFLDFTGSDHKPIVVHINDSTPYRHRPFRFDKRLVDIPEFKQVVKEGWNIRNNLQTVAITERIRSCRKAMASLKHRSNLNAEVRIRTLQTRLNRSMESTVRAERQQIPQIQEALARAYDDEEKYWKQKSRNQWMKEGDRNTSYFHACAKNRFSQNRIISILDDQGRVHSGNNDIGAHAQAFFNNIYTTNGIQVSPMDFADFRPTVTQTINTDLTREFGDNEIYDAICQIGDDKAPGPDGLTARFYKQCWHIVGQDVIKEVKNFFTTSTMKPHINHTNLCLLPKIENPSTFSDYRPIALCNVLYKVISKCMVSRLKSHLDSIVSEAQAAFIPGRIINDNVMIAHEIMHSLKVRKRVSQTYMAVKTDVSKAYDRVEWEFLETTMRLFGFCDTWIGWVMAAVKSVRFSVLINGTPFGHIKPTRGIRQGDPLSPYLFILCGDILSHLIKSKASDGEIRGVRVGNGAPPITHLQFADDCLFFCQANVKNCKALKEAFDVYEYYSGQKINAQKSMITFGSRVFGSTQHRLKAVLGIPNQGGGGKYLGLPEQFGRKKKEMFKYIIERVKKRTSNWSAKFLSPAGKEIMIKSVALAMPVYAMSCFKLPQGIISEIETLLMNFWWEKSSNKRGIPWIAWKKLQYSKKEGGLGFRDLSKFNDALLAKQAWRIIQHPQSLFARLMTTRYFKGESILKAKARRQQSYGWSSLLAGIALLKKGTRYIPGDGKTIQIGADNFVDAHPPRPLITEPENAELTLDNLINCNGNSRTWNVTKIMELVNPTDHSLIYNSYLSRVKKPDTIIWNYNSSGDYTVRSGYWFLTHDPSEAINTQPGRPHGSIELKNRLTITNIVMKKRLSLKQILVTLSNLGVCLCVKHLDNNKIQDSNAEIKNESLCPEDDSAIEGRRRIKMVITRKQLDRLLAKQVSLEEIVFVNQRTSLSCFDDSKWIPRLESIHESPEL